MSIPSSLQEHSQLGNNVRLYRRQVMIVGARLASSQQEATMLSFV